MATKGKADYVRKGDYSYLPPHMRYAMQNPVVGVLMADMTDKDREEEEAYESKVGKPDIASKNYYLLIKGDPDRLERAYKETGSYYREHIKRNTGDALESDKKQIASIYKMIDDAKRRAKLEAKR